MTTSGRELRLALGMRGGVSLAVWIGGACAEIDALRRAAPGDGSFWTGQLAGAGFNSVNVDVMAGASAGGLNAVLFAAAQHYGFPFERIREIWLDKGDITGLMRPDGPDSPSLLDGDNGFLQVMFEELCKLVDQANGVQAEAGEPSDADASTTGAAAASRPTIDVRLSATHVEPIVRRTPSPNDEQLSVNRSAAAFRFRHTAGHDWMPSDFPPYAPPGDHEHRRRLEAALWRLVLAARATSSFPVAFEAASVRSRRPRSFSERRPDAPGWQVDAFGVFTDARDDADDFMVLDGGWLDNIPLKRALEAIAGAPAEGPTSRYLVYLQPGEPAAPTAPAPEGDTSEEERRQARRRSTTNVMRGMVQAIWSSETIAVDIEALEEHNRCVASGQVLRAAAFGPIDDAASVLVAARRMLPAYFTLRSTEDAASLRALLDDPIAYMGEDPFPTSVPEPRAPLAGWSVHDRTNLDGVLGRKFNLDAATEHLTPLEAISTGSLMRNGLGPIARVTRLTLEWVCHLERSGLDVAAQKRTLYRTLLFVDQVLARNRRMSWVLSAALRAAPADPGLAEYQGSLDDWTDTGMQHANRLLCHTSGLVDAVIEELNGTASGGIGQFVVLVAARLDEQAAGAVADTDGQFIDIRERVVDAVLVPVVTSLAGEIVADEDSPGGLLHRALRNHPSPQSALEGLSAVEVLGMPEFVYGAPGERAIEFRRMSAASATPLALELTDLRAHATAKAIDWPVPDQVPLKLKLAGNELMNFASFLRPEWRANDWMWGRLDAVRTLVDLLNPIDPGLDQVSDEYRMATASRNALVTERQTQILRTELGLRPWYEPIEADGLVSDDTVRRFLNEYMVGAETVTSNRSLATVEIAQHLSASAAHAIRWNAALEDPATEGPSTVTKVANAVAKAVAVAGRFGASLALAPRPAASDEKFRNVAFWFFALLVIVFAVAAPLGWASLTDWKVALATAVGIVALILVLVLIVFAVKFWLSPRAKRTARSIRRK
jgi:predicted acylesterase/phospholipase RssA